MEKVKKGEGASRVQAAGEAYLILKDLTKVFERRYETLSHWLKDLNLERYGVRVGRELRFTKEDVVRFINEELKKRSDGRFKEEELKRFLENLENIETLVSGDGRHRRDRNPKFLRWALTTMQPRQINTAALPYLASSLGVDSKLLLQLIDRYCTPAERVCLIPFLFGGLSQEEIAKKLDVSKQDVNLRIRYGLHKLLQGLRHEGIKKLTLTLKLKA
jgi:hypothetical protein